MNVQPSPAMTSHAQTAFQATEGAVRSAAQDRQQGGPLDALAHQNAQRVQAVVDSIDISPAARLAAQIARHNATLTNSTNGPATVQGVHPIIDGNAEIKRAAKSGGKG